MTATDYMEGLKDPDGDPWAKHTLVIFLCSLSYSDTLIHYCSLNFTFEAERGARAVLIFWWRFRYTSAAVM